ncbi:MAG TPA: thioesterase family protein [Pyrinomonadaceae bacterium]|jgi:acyl-CoA thioester hydrolase
MSEIYEKTFHVGWAQVDFNGHLGNTSFMDLAVDVRMFYFAENGFPIQEFQRQRFGPVILKDEIEYFREFRLLDAIRITLQSAGLSEDGSRFKIRNEFYRADGKLAARLDTIGGWLNLDKRKLIVPPENLANAMRGLARTGDFEVFPTSVKS